MSTANAHPGLSFGVGGLRRGFPSSHSSTGSKAPPSLPQHAPQYQPQAFAPQPSAQGTYPRHLFSNPTPPTVPSIANLPNGTRSAQAQVPPNLHGSRQRAPPPRQMPSQPNQPLSYLQQSMNPQPLAQQPISQPSLNQSVQQTEPPLLSQQSASHPPPQSSLPPQQPAQPQVSQPSQATQSAKASQASQIQPQQQPVARQPENVAPRPEQHHDDDEEEGSPESGDPDASLEARLAEGRPFVPRQPMGHMMSPPPEGGSYPTLEAVHKAVLAYTTSVGYAVVIGRSKKTVPGLKKVLFVCDRAGKPPKRVSPEMRKRKTSSRKCDCPFGFFAIEQRTQWTIRYRPDHAHLRHNHGPSESPLLHPAARKLDSKMVAAVKTLKDSGVGVNQTLEILQADNPHLPLLPRDIYNARAAINRNPEKVATELADNLPAIYSRPPPSAEERIRSELRRELAKTREDMEKLKADSQKEIEELKEKMREKDKMIEKFEMFIDICNQRVILQRERLASDGTEANDAVSASAA